MILRLKFLSLFHLNFELRIVNIKIKVVTSLFKPYKLFVVIPTQEMHSEKFMSVNKIKETKPTLKIERRCMLMHYCNLTKYLMITKIESSKKKRAGKKFVSLPKIF